MEWMVSRGRQWIETGEDRKWIKGRCDVRDVQGIGIGGVESK